jgi:hypothetical protein
MAMLNNQMVTDKWWLVDDVLLSHSLRKSRKPRRHLNRPRLPVVYGRLHHVIPSFLLRNTWVCPNTVDLYTPNKYISFNVENEVLNHEKNQGLIIGRMFQGHFHLVGGFKHFLFSIIYGIILPIDFHIFQRGWNHQPVYDVINWF